MRTYLLALMFTSGLACSPKQNENLAKNPKAEMVEAEKGKSGNSTQTPAIGQPSVDEESLVVPVNITGALLTCAIRKEATDTSPEAEIGCRLTDAVTGKKVAPDAMLSFSNSNPGLVTSNIQPDASIYHVLYSIKGVSKNAILQATQNLDAIVLYRSSAIRTEKVTKVLKPAIELDDYDAPVVRDQAIDKDDNGSL